MIKKKIFFLILDNLSVVYYSSVKIFILKSKWTPSRVLISVIFINYRLPFFDSNVNLPQLNFIKASL
ncbi:hypothetical protein CV688_05285 [Borreliella burgdorferi]|nr:hypothetical protein CV688_05285 [Borreliella burgdorferi]